MNWRLLAVMVALALAAGCGSAPGESASAAALPATKTVRPPPVAAVVDYQLGGAYNPAAAVKVVIRDRTDAPAKGRYGICYVNAFQSQPDAGKWWRDNHLDLLLKGANGKPMRDPGWPGEYLFDISTAAKRRALAQIVGAWIDGCAADGYKAIEPDNLDSFTRSRGHLRVGQARAFARLLIARAHGAGLAIAQKNTVEIDGKALGFDFAIAEECSVYDECADYTAMYGRRVIEIEYTDSGRAAYNRACREAAGKRSILLRDRDVVPRGERGYVFRHC